MSIIQGKAGANSVLYSNGIKTCDGLVNYGFKQYFRVNHGENEFSIGWNYINGIENFWGRCKVCLTKFCGMSKKTFYYTSKSVNLGIIAGIKIYT